MEKGPQAERTRIVPQIAELAMTLADLVAAQHESRFVRGFVRTLIRPFGAPSPEKGAMVPTGEGTA